MDQYDHPHSLPSPSSLNTPHWRSTDTAAQKVKWGSSDTIWLLSLYGTAIGGGVLFLPINAGAGGLIPLLLITVLAFPMTFFSHRALCHFVLSSSLPEGDITTVTEAHFGKTASNLITFLYFLAIYPILLVYSVGITNTVISFLENQLNMVAPHRAILSFSLIALLMLVVHFGENLIIKVMSVLVFPFLGILMLLSFYLIPHWNMALFENVSFNGASGQELWLTLWLTIPIMVFSFNHSPIISSLDVAKRKEYREHAESKCTRIIAYSNILMVITVMFLVRPSVSCLKI